MLFKIPHKFYYSAINDAVKDRLGSQNGIPKILSSFGNDKDAVVWLHWLHVGSLWTFDNLSLDQWRLCTSLNCFTEHLSHPEEMHNLMIFDFLPNWVGLLFVLKIFETTQLMCIE